MKGTADVSEHPKEKVGVVRRNGVRFADLEFQKKKIKQSLADPESKFRHDKDRLSRLRIRLAEQLKKKKSTTKLKRTKRFIGIGRSDLDIPMINLAKF